MALSGYSNINFFSFPLSMSLHLMCLSRKTKTNVILSGTSEHVVLECWRWFIQFFTPCLLSAPSAGSLFLSVEQDHEGAQRQLHTQESRVTVTGEQCHMWSTWRNWGCFLLEKRADDIRVFSNIWKAAFLVARRQRNQILAQFKNFLIVRICGFLKILEVI